MNKDLEVDTRHIDDAQSRATYRSHNGIMRERWWIWIGTLAKSSTAELSTAARPLQNAAASEELIGQSLRRSAVADKVHQPPWLARAATRVQRGHLAIESKRAAFRAILHGRLPRTTCTLHLGMEIRGHRDTTLSPDPDGRRAPHPSLRRRSPSKPKPQLDEGAVARPSEVPEQEQGRVLTNTSQRLIETPRDVVAPMWSVFH